MLLAVDIGNTNIVFGVLDGERVLCTWRVPSIADITETDYQTRFEVALIENGLTNVDITDSIIASVVPVLTANVKHFLQSKGFSPLIVGEENLILGIDIRLDKPKEVGADRLVNAVAAYALIRKRAIIIDFGTATTFDLVDDDGSYIGGLICPGIKLSLKALHDATAKLPQVDFAKIAEEDIIGKSTIHAMQSGMYWGYVGLVEGIIKRLKQVHADSRVIATGGLASTLAPALSEIDHVDDTLTLQGLRLIFERNRH